MSSVKAVLLTILAVAPVSVFAYDDGLKGLLERVKELVGLALPIAIALAVLFFIWGLVIFIKNSGESEAQAEGKTKMLWGIIALFVIVSIWGIVGFIGYTVGVGPAIAPDVPQLPGYNSGQQSGANGSTNCPPGYYYSRNGGGCAPN